MGKHFYLLRKGSRTAAGCVEAWVTEELWRVQLPQGKVNAQVSDNTHLLPRF